MSVHQFCEDHHIMYSLACGTLIGAVRHQGFIPWDDDVDIYMLRNDYNRFLDIYHDETGHYQAISLETSKDWKQPYAKVFDTHTLLIEQSNTNVDGVGFGIDVFPIDAAPDSLADWQKYEKRRVLLQRLFGMKKMVWREGRSLAKNIFLYMMKFFLLPFSMRSMAKMIDRYAKKYNDMSTSYLAESCFGNPNNRFAHADFSTSVDIYFQGHQLKAMNGFENYLRAFYGDYMKLPPKEQRITHHAFKVFWT